MKDYSVLEGLDNNFMIELRCAYDRGYRQGRDDEWAETQAKQKGNEYERGLNDAWRVITEFLLMGDFDRGMTFNTRFLDELLKLEPQNAVERLKLYNKKSEPIVMCCKNCKHSENGMVGNSKRCEDCYYDEVSNGNTLFEPMETDNSKIEVGDIVETNGFSKPVIVINAPYYLDSSTEIKVMNFLGDTAWKNINDCKKTGKHIQQIEEVFNMLRDNKNA